MDGRKVDRAAAKHLGRPFDVSGRWHHARREVDGLGVGHAGGAHAALERLQPRLGLLQIDGHGEMAHRAPSQRGSSAR